MPKSKSRPKADRPVVVKPEMVKEISKPIPTMKGRVVSTKMTKTAVVLIERDKMHPLYGKSFRRSKKYLVHDEVGVSDGDVVEIVKTKPFSKNKHWQVLRIAGKDMEAILTEKLKEKAAEEIAEVMPEKPSVSVDQNTSELVDQQVSEPEKSEKPKRKKKEAK